ncbi:MAG: hypothetical protein II754_03560 [Lachnospiraceae bacterium]|nr:hypothetical protein [Lachnospiraceae bacterium]
MRLKFYLRGAGIGMILTAVLLIIGNAVIPKDLGGNAELSTEDTEREPSIAEALENREKNTETEAVTEAGSEKTAETEKASEPNTEASTEKVSEPSSEEAVSERTTETGRDEDGRYTVTVRDHSETPESVGAEETGTTEKTIEEEEPDQSSETAEPSAPPQGGPAEIRIYRGDGPSVVAERLKEAGVIQDAKAYVDYLIANGMNDYLEVGTFTLTPGANFKTITDILTTNEFERKNQN